MIKQFSSISLAALLILITFSCADNQPSVTRVEFEKLIADGKVEQVIFIKNSKELIFTTHDSGEETKIILDGNQTPEMYFRLSRLVYQNNTVFVLTERMDYRSAMISWGIALIFPLIYLAIMGLAISRIMTLQIDLGQKALWVLIIVLIPMAGIVAAFIKAEKNRVA